MSDESINVIHFWDTPKGDITHYSCIFSNLYPLGGDLNNTACSRLGAVLYLEIKWRRFQ